jgi:hypothetical protein
LTKEAGAEMHFLGTMKKNITKIQGLCNVCIVQSKLKACLEVPTQ